MKTVPVVNGPIKPANFAEPRRHGQHLVTTNEAFSCINGCKVVMPADISIPVSYRRYCRRHGDRRRAAIRSMTLKPRSCHDHDHGISDAVPAEWLRSLTLSVHLKHVAGLLSGSVTSHRAGQQSQSPAVSARSTVSRQHSAASRRPRRVIVMVWCLRPTTDQQSLTVNTE